MSIDGEHSDYFQCHQGLRQGVTDYALSKPE